MGQASSLNVPENALFDPEVAYWLSENTDSKSDALFVKISCSQYRWTEILTSGMSSPEIWQAAIPAR